MHKQCSCPLKAETVQRKKKNKRKRKRRRRRVKRKTQNTKRDFQLDPNPQKLSPSKKKITLPHHKMKASKSSHPRYQLMIDPKQRPNHSQNLNLAADWPPKAIPSQDRFIQK